MRHGAASPPRHRGVTAGRGTSSAVVTADRELTAGLPACTPRSAGISGGTRRLWGRSTDPVRPAAHRDPTPSRGLDRP